MGRSPRRRISMTGCQSRRWASGARCFLLAGYAVLGGLLPVLGARSAGRISDPGMWVEGKIFRCSAFVNLCLSPVCATLTFFLRQ